KVLKYSLKATNRTIKELKPHKADLGHKILSICKVIRAVSIRKNFTYLSEHLIYAAVSTNES
ncbi:MAG: hypothetical protein ACLFPE_06850, partial [Bacteroidales bacterium]